MSSTILPDSGVQVELVDHAPLKMREFRAWLKAEQDGDFLAQYAFITPMIASWDHPTLDAHDQGSLDELSLRDFGALSRGCSAVIQRTASEKNSPG